MYFPVKVAQKHGTNQRQNAGLLRNSLWTALNVMRCFSRFGSRHANDAMPWDFFYLLGSAPMSTLSLSARLRGQRQKESLFAPFSRSPYWGTKAVTCPSVKIRAACLHTKITLNSRLLSLIIPVANKKPFLSLFFVVEEFVRWHGVLEKG